MRFLSLLTWPAHVIDQSVKLIKILPSFEFVFFQPKAGRPITKFQDITMKIIWSEVSLPLQDKWAGPSLGRGRGVEVSKPICPPPRGKQIENKIVLSVNNGPNIPLALTKILIDPKGILWWTYIVCYNNQFFYKQKNFRALRTLSSSILFYFNTPHFRHVAFF